jgi:dTDP-4-dehydrorhamnose reductase
MKAAAPLRITVTGLTGQVVQSLLDRAASHGVVVTAVGRPALDLLHPDTVLAALAATQPDCIVNAAAYTAVDRAEAEPHLAEAINGIGAGAVAGAAATLKVPLVQLSTDYVFDGTLDRPYRESDAIGPVGVYGSSKLQGELAVMAATDDHAILRTSWVYSPYGGNFIKTMLRLAETRDEISVVADQHGNPSSALDIADVTIAIARQLCERRHDATLRGIFHLSGSGATTWAGFAEEIFRVSAEQGARKRPCARSRPANTRHLRVAPPIPGWIAA